MFTTDLKKKIEQAKRIARDAIKEKSLMDYNFIKHLGEPTSNSKKVLLPMEKLGAIVAKKINDTTGFIPITDPREYIQFLTQEGYSLASLDEVIKLGLIPQPEDYKYNSSERRFIVDTKFYTERMMESFSYYSDNFVLFVHLKIEGDSIVFKDTGKRIGKGTAAGRLLIQFAIANRKEVPVDEVFDNISEATQYKNIIYSHVAKLFKLKFPNSDGDEIDSELREQLKVQTEKKKLIHPERVQFIFDD